MISSNSFQEYLYTFKKSLHVIRLKLILDRTMKVLKGIWIRQYMKKILIKSTSICVIQPIHLSYLSYCYLIAKRQRGKN